MESARAGWCGWRLGIRPRPADEKNGRSRGCRLHHAALVLAAAAGVTTAIVAVHAGRSRGIAAGASEKEVASSPRTRKTAKMFLTGNDCAPLEPRIQFWAVIPENFQGEGVKPPLSPSPLPPPLSPPPWPVDWTEPQPAPPPGLPPNTPLPPPATPSPLPPFSPSPPSPDLATGEDNPETWRHMPMDPPWALNGPIEGYLEWSLAEFVKRRWYVIEQQVTGYHSAEDMFCGIQTFKLEKTWVPFNSPNSVVVSMYHYANAGGVNGPPTGQKPTWHWPASKEALCGLNAPCVDNPDRKITLCGRVPRPPALIGQAAKDSEGARKEKIMVQGLLKFNPWVNKSDLIPSYAPWRMKVAPCWLPNTFAGDFWVLDVGYTEYDSDEYEWAIVIAGEPKKTIYLEGGDEETEVGYDGCTTKESGTAGSGLWLLSRSADVRDATRHAMYRALAARGIARSRLMPVEHIGCFYEGAPPDVVHYGINSEDELEEETGQLQMDPNQPEMDSSHPDETADPAMEAEPREPFKSQRPEGAFAETESFVEPP